MKVVRWVFVLGLAAAFLAPSQEGLAQEEWTAVLPAGGIEEWESTQEGAWRLIGGILSGQPQEGGKAVLVGPEIPGDFALRLEFKVLGHRRAAVHFRSHWLDQVVHGYKIEIPPFWIEGAGFERPGGTAGDLYLAGRDDEAISFADDNASENPMASFRNWNQLELRAKGSDIEITINGIQVTKVQDDRFLGGRLIFEAGDLGGMGMVMLQNIQYQDLTDETEYTSLFNGENLDGWKIHGEEKQWVVREGVIHSESVDDAYSYLATDDQYKNFSVIAEFLGLAGGNSGLFFHSHLDGTRISGIQAEVQPPNGDRLGHSGCLYDSSGRGWLIDPETLAPEKEAVFRMGEWNTIRVDVKDHHIKTWLNGMQIVDFKDDKPAHDTGVIALQIHSGGGVKVDWRNLRVKELK